MDRKESIQIMMHQKESIQIMMHKKESIQIMMHQNGSIIQQLVGFDHTLGQSVIFVSKRGAPNGGLDYAPFFALGPFARLF
jgi:hypothetical protein